MINDKRRKLYDGFKINNFRELVYDRYSMFLDKSAFEFRKTPTSNIKKITYKEFINNIKQLGTALINMGLSKKKVAIIAPNRYEWCTSYLAITTSNMVVVPLDKSLPNNEIEGLIVRSEAEAVIFDEKYIDIFQDIKKSNVSSLKAYICMDFDKEHDGILSYSKLLEFGASEIANGNNSYEDIKVNDDAMSIMLFTSGTTSISKAVMLSQKNICSDIYSLSSMAKVTSEDRFLSFLPLHHTFESTCTFLYGSSVGISICFTDGLKYISKNLKDYNITGFVCVPLVLEIMYKKIIKEAEKTNQLGKIVFGRKLANFLLKFNIDIRRKLFKQILDQLGGHLRLLIAGGAAMDKDAIQAFEDFGINLLQGYGLTETSPVVAGENDKYKRAGSVGFPLPDIDVKIDNPDEDGIGEVIIHSPTVMLGYYENEQATNEVLKKDENGDIWFYSGDLGKFDKNGFLFLTGRKKFVIVLKNGKKVFPEEVELLINKLPFVEESLVFGVPDKDGDVKLCAKIIFNEENLNTIYPEITKENYQSKIMDNIKNINHTMPPYKYIRSIIISTEPLIKTTTQKVRRNEEINNILESHVI